MGVTINKSQQQQNHRLRTDSNLSHRGGGGLKCILLVPNLRPRFCCCWSIRNVHLAWKLSYFCNVSSWKNTLVKLTHYGETKKMATDSNKSSDFLLNPVCIMLIYIITVLLCKYLCIVLYVLCYVWNEIKFKLKKRAHDSQKVRAKKAFKLSHGGSSYRWASGTNPPIKALRQSRHRVWGLTHRRAIKKETIAIKCDWP